MNLEDFTSEELTGELLRRLQEARTVEMQYTELRKTRNGLKDYLEHAESLDYQLPPDCTPLERMCLRLLIVRVSNRLVGSAETFDELFGEAYKLLEVMEDHFTDKWVSGAYFLGQKLGQDANKSGMGMLDRWTSLGDFFEIGMRRMGVLTAVSAECTEEAIKELCFWYTLFRGIIPTITTGRVFTSEAQLDLLERRMLETRRLINDWCTTGKRQAFGWGKHPELSLVEEDFANLGQRLADEEASRNALDQLQ